MILDSLQNSQRYEQLNPRFKMAFDFLKNTDFSTLAPGKIELSGNELFVTLAEADGKEAHQAALETHQQYIDIQMPLSGVETMGWKAVDQLQTPSAPYCNEKDIAFFGDAATNFIHVAPGQFAVFFPEDAHAPLIASGRIRKVIVKVLI